jgi:hypothetical protein
MRYGLGPIRRTHDLERKQIRFAAGWTDSEPPAQPHDRHEILFGGAEYCEGSEEEVRPPVDPGPLGEKGSIGNHRVITQGTEKGTHGPSERGSGRDSSLRENRPLEESR